MKKYGQAKQIAFWLLLAALALAPFAGTAAASYTAGGGEVEDGVFYAIAIGTIDSRPPEVTGEYAIAIGASTKADGACGTAVGYFASAIGLYSSAYGQFVSAKGEGSVATGCEAQATGLYSAATGFEAEASGIRSSAYGAKAQAMGTGSLAAGSDAYAGGANGTAVGFSASAGGENSSAYGMGAYAQGTDSLAAGNGAGAVDANTTAVGASAVAKFEGSTAIGYKANATIAGSVALGAGSYANRTTTATGVYVPAGASGGGITATVKGTDKGVVSIGDATDVKGHVAFTRQLTALAAGIEDTDAVNVAQLKALDSVAVKYDNDTKTAVILNSGGAAVKLSNVADAVLDNTSTQAVTGKQLYAANQTIATNRTNIETNKASIETNKASIATNETKIASNTTNITANAAQLKALDDVAVKYDDTKTAVILNSGGAAVKLSNVADAVLDNTSTQAVTGKQLYAANQTIATNRTNIETNKASIETNKASIATNETKIASNTTNITTNTTGIKENKTAITAVSGDVATKYTALDGRIAANTNEIAAVSGDVATKYTTLDGRIAANEASINTVSGDVAAKYTDLGGRITANTNEIAAVSGDVATKYTTLDGRITANETNIATLDTRVTSHDTRIATNETNIAANTTSIGTLDTRVTSHDTRIATNETNIASNTTSIGTLDTRVTSHDARIATNADAITTNKLSIDTVSGDVRMLDGRVKANTASINTVSADVAGLRGEITASGVKYDDDSKEVLTLNKGGAAVRLSNVADAELSDASTQAVTGKQLYETNQTINTVSGDVAAKYTVLDGRVAANETSINTVSGDVAALRGEIAASGIHYDDPSNSVVTLNKGGNAVRLTNIAAGTADSDAVNYGQLKALGGKVETFGETLAERIGGTYDPVTGEFTVTYPDGPTPANPAAQASASSAASAPSPASAQNAAQAAAQAASTPHLSETLQNMWDAIGAVQAGNVKAGDNIVVDGTKVSVSKTPEFERVKVGNIDIREEGIDMGGKPITGLAKGEIYDGSGDAVTGGQLWNAYRRIETIDERVQVVGAHAAALSAMHPVAYNPYEPTTLSAGVGYYRSEYSMAVGIFHYARENVLLNAGIAFNSDGDTMGRAGISFALGKSGRKQPSMIKDVAAMQRQMMEMQQVLTQLKEENEKNKDTIKELKDALKDKK